MVENLCRACLLNEEVDDDFQNMQMPFNEDDLTIGFIFTKITTVQHNPSDGLPQKICQKCFEELIASYAFQRKCIKSDIEIRNLIANVSVCIETQKSNVKLEIETENEGDVDVDDWTKQSDDENVQTQDITESSIQTNNVLDEYQIERPNPKNKRKSRYKCEICNKVFDRNYSFNRHKKSHKPGQSLDYKCEICDCKFAKESNLTKHLDENHLDNTQTCFPCPYCPRKFLKKASRSAHMQYHKTDEVACSQRSITSYLVPVENKNFQIQSISNDIKPFEIVENENCINVNNNVEIKNQDVTNLLKTKFNANDDEESDEVELPNPKNKRKAVHECEVCSKTFDRKYRLQRHLNIHNPDGRPYECAVCKWRFASEQNLTRHAIIHTAVADCLKENNEKPKIYRCVYCPRKFAKKESLASHMRVHKTNMPSTEIQMKNFKCQFCPKAFYKITSLTRHLYTHDDEKDFKCNLCDKSFSLRGQLVDHMNWHKGIKPFQCEICTKSFNQSCTLKDHMRTHSGEKPFLCSECGKGFNNSSNLRQHSLRHSGDKPFKCSECPSSFTSKGGLKSHMSTHTKLKPHVCDICGSSFTKRYSLKKHKRIHTGEKPYECTTCHMRFTSSNHLKRHIRTHTGEKPYACKFCERAFAQSNDLVKHLKSHLGDKIYKCERCGEAFRLHTELRDHQYEHYREEKQKQQQNGMINGEEQTKNDQDLYECNRITNDVLINQKIELKCELEEPIAKNMYSDNVQYSCLNCEAVFSNLEHLNTHQINEHNKIEISQ